MTKNRENRDQINKEVRQKNNYISIMKADWFNSKFKKIWEISKVKK